MAHIIVGCFAFNMGKNKISESEKILSRAYNNEKDEQLIEKFKKGDFKALETLYKRYESLSKKIGSFKESKEDNPGITLLDYSTIFSEAFYLALTNYDPTKGLFGPYWRRIARNELIHELNKNKIYYEKIAFSLDESIDGEKSASFAEIIGSKEKDPFERIREEESTLNYALKDGITSLEPLEEEIVAARIFGERVESIARKLKMTPSQVQAKIVTARIKLKAKLKLDDLDEDFLNLD